MAIKTNWTDAVANTPDLGGDGVTSRGSDPQVNLESGSPINAMWDNPVVPVPSGEESPNSVSGLPARPTRWEPSETPPDPPSLQDRNPGTLKG